MAARRKIDALRVLMEERGLDAYIIPSGDPHSSEYTADYWRSREWISGFTGSAGLVVVLHKEAGLWTDGRYFIQAEQELADSGITLFKTGEPDVPAYQAFLAEKLPENGKVGFDGRVLSAEDFKKLNAALKEKKPVFSYNDDLVGRLWKNRPPIPTEKAIEHAPSFAGKPASEKLAEVRAKMKEKKLTAYLVTTLDSVAWLLNIRGRDIANFPVIYAFALITETEAHVFADFIKMANVSGKLIAQGFTIHEYEALPQLLQNLETSKLYYNALRTNVLVSESVPKKSDAKNALKHAEDIIPLLKSTKSQIEIENIRIAYIREGIVMVKMFAWLEDALQTETLTEADVSWKLTELRSKQPHYLCDSFSTISAYGENAALSHYNPGETGVTLQKSGFFLVDTGGNYLDGTTDTTRTICLGEITEEMRRDFTLVLKGNIALTRCVFPKGTTGSALDAIARQPLWFDCQNFNHGTGHGIGYCLNVHEGPQNIAQHPNPVALAPGMLVSNEPGLYKKGCYGIRTENILLVTRHKNPRQETTGDYYAFETLTHCPIDTRAVDPAMLTQTERDHLNTYHKRVYETLAPHLNDIERDRLKKMVAAI